MLKKMENDLFSCLSVDGEVDGGICTVENNVSLSSETGVNEEKKFS